MKQALRTTLICVVAIALGYAAYARRLEISAMVWHWKNGNLARVGAYEVPVPDGWLVKVSPSGLIFLTDVRVTRDLHPLSEINVITIDTMLTPTPNLNSWKSYKEQLLKKNGVNSLEERSLSFEDEAVICLGGYELHDVMQLPDTTDVVSVDCRSSSTLHLMFVGQRPDLELFYSIIPKIRK